MIEERAVVIEAGEDYVWVETQRQTSCGACSANQGCGTAALAKVLGNRRARVRALARIPLQAGDEVIVGLSENALVKGAFAVYMVPLLLMLFGALLGEWVFTAANEEIAILLGALGLLAGFAWLLAFARGIQTDIRFQPIVLRRFVPAPWESVPD